MIPVNIIDSIRLKDVKLLNKVKSLAYSAGTVKWVPLTTYTNPGTTAITIADLSTLDLNKVKEATLNTSIDITNNLTVAANQTFTTKFTYGSTTLTNVITAPSAYTALFSVRQELKMVYTYSDATNHYFDAYLSTDLYQVVGSGAISGITKTANQVVVVAVPVGSTAFPTYTITAQTGTAVTTVTVNDVKINVIYK